jgi:hypothetical protein
MALTAISPRRGATIWQGPVRGPIGAKIRNVISHHALPSDRAMSRHRLALQALIE